MNTNALSYSSSATLTTPWYAESPVRSDYADAKPERVPTRGTPQDPTRVPREQRALLMAEPCGTKAVRPLFVTVRAEGGLYVVEENELGISGIGPTVSEAVTDFKEFLEVDYRAYINESDERLDAAARRLRERYREMFSRR